MPIRSYKMSICTQLFKHTMTGPTWTFPSFMFRAIAYPFAPLRHIVYKPTHQASACLLGDKTTHTKAAFLIKSFVLYHIKRHCRQGFDPGTSSTTVYINDICNLIYVWRCIIPQLRFRKIPTSTCPNCVLLNFAFGH